MSAVEFFLRKNPSSQRTRGYTGEFYLMFACEVRRRAQLRFEEVFYASENLGSAFGLVDLFAQVCAAGDAVGEPTGELLHLADRVGEFFFDQHLEVGADHLVAVGLGGVIVGISGGVLFDLAEDPGIRWGGAADHDGVTSSLGDHGAGVFGAADIAVADDRNLHGIFYGGDPFPAGLAA